MKLFGNRATTLAICSGVILSFYMLYTTVSQEKIHDLRDWVVDQTLPWRTGVMRERNLMVGMRDGVFLRTHVLLPAKQKNRTLSVVLMRSSYSGFSFEWSKYFVDHGYAVVQQHIRGRYGSEGEFSPHAYSRQDGYDTIGWIVNQHWSNGKVGTFGCSYLGETQILTAAERHPAHRALIADGAGGAIGSARDAYGYFGVYDNGILNLASALGWFTGHGAKGIDVTPVPLDLDARIVAELEGLPVNQLAGRVVPYPTELDEMLAEELTSSWWREAGYLHDSDRFSAAALHVNTWYDQTVHGTFRTAKFMEESADNLRAQQQNLLIGPGNHCSTDNLESGLVKIGEMSLEYHALDYPALYLEWFDHWLKGREITPFPKFRYFLIHANRWLESAVWPPAKTVMTPYFVSGNHRLKRSEVKAHGMDSFIYDPLKPVPSRGGSICCTGRPSDISGAVDQRELRQREDVLFYQSESVPSDISLTGNAIVGLWVSSSAKDTDFMVKLVDIYPHGQSYNIVDSGIRMRYRNGIDKPKLLTPGEKVFVTFELPPMAYLLREGHRIELQVTSSNFPRLARNLNTGASEYGDDQVVVANNTLFYGLGQASFISLPIVQE
jgi:putative CocE/NonD family hydrolase